MNPDALPQPIGEFQPLDEWQAHINRLFYGFRGGRLEDNARTFAAADYRLAHALAADYYDGVVRREAIRAASPGTRPASPLLVMEWGCGNGNLAACFLSHLKTLDEAGSVSPRVRYLLVDNQPAVLKAALAHPDLSSHRERVSALCVDVQALGAVKDASVDRIVCNELWSELPTKLLARKESEVEEEHLRPNLSAAKHGAINDWPRFVRAFGEADLDALKAFPVFLEDLVWECDYRAVEWKDVPYRKTITEFLKRIDEKVLVPVNLGACETVKEAKRLLSPDAVGFSSFDAGTADLDLLNDPEKPCYTQVGGRYSFLLNFALIEAVVRHLGIKTVAVEPQRAFVGRSLGTNVISLMDLLAMHPSARSLTGWEQDRLILRTIQALNRACRSPYRCRIEYPLPQEMPASEREALERVVGALEPDGVPDTIAYLNEEEVFGAIEGLDELGYDREAIRFAFAAPPQPVDYTHFFFQR